jgi:hypothetical protein
MLKASMLWRLESYFAAAISKNFIFVTLQKYSTELPDEEINERVMSGFDQCQAIKILPVLIT